MLPNYQQSIVDKLYDECINNQNQIISLNGKSGCGKSHIVQALAENLCEGWTTFLIEGIGKSLSPYQTLYVGTQLKEKKILKPNISFGIEFAPFTFSMTPQIEEMNYVFNKYEQAILRSLRAKDPSMPNILIIADNLDEWDPSSVEFLIKLQKHKPFINRNLKLLIVGSDQVYNSIKIDTKYTIPEFSLADYEEIIEVLGFKHQVDIMEAKACTGGNIEMLKLYCEYVKPHDEKAMLDINTIISRKIEECNEYDSEQIKHLPPIAIIGGNFSVYDAAYSEENSEKKYADVINIAKKHDFLYGNEEYCFSSKVISDYFKAQLHAKEALLHKDFALYLKKKKPEDYFSRAKHLIGANEQADLEEAYYLLCIEQARRNSIHTNTQYFEELYNKIKTDSKLSDLNENGELYLKGIGAFIKCDYRSAIDYFNEIILLGTPNLFHAEVFRNILMSQVLLASDYHEIDNVSEKLFELIEDTAFDEEEQWVRACIVLLSVYMDRVYDNKKADDLNKKICKIFQYKRNSQFFTFMEYQYKRRAAMFYPPLFALRHSKGCEEYFNKRYDVDEVYKSQCNFGANCLICREHNEAKEVLERCLKLIDDCPEVSFPSQYKVKNNSVLANFFVIAEEHMQRHVYPKEDMVLQSSKIALEELESITGSENGEISHVISLNRISFLLLLSEFDRANLLIQNLLSNIRNEDLFYNYYLNNMRIAYYCLTGNKEAALDTLDLIKNVFVPLIMHSKKIFQHRYDVIEEMICQEHTPTPFEFNYHYLTKNQVADTSWYFWGRGLLLSDLQFLSL